MSVVMAHASAGYLRAACVYLHMCETSKRCDAGVVTGTAHVSSLWIVDKNLLFSSLHHQYNFVW